MYATMNTLVEYLFFLAPLRLSQAKITSSCGTADSYWEVREGKKDNTFTCTGLSANDTVTWNLRENELFPNDPDLGSCRPRLSNGSFPPCEMPYNPYFKPSRLSDDAGIMIFNSSSSSASTFFDRGRIVCSILGSTSAGCRLDYIYSPENISCTVEFSNDFWSVLGQCDIKKTNSSQKRYRCEWTQTKESPEEVILIANTSMLVVPHDGKYVSGTCNLTSYLPSNGQYTYSVTVVPGEVIVNANFIGSNEIRRPNDKTFHNCPQYVAEGGNLTCTCSVRDLGSPPGVLYWYPTLSTQLNLSNVSRTDSTKYSCQLHWNNTLEQSENYTVNVAYGPDTVIPIISPQPLDTDGFQSITLNCTSSQSNPPASVTWIRSPDTTVLCSSQLCVFTPKPPEEDGIILNCLARNPVTNRTSSNNVTVTLNYPPNSSPVITVSPSFADIAYEGDNITVRCTVSGGKPVTATVITLACPYKTDMTPGNSDSSSISSSLMFLPVRSENHGRCVCNAKWKRSDWYNKTVSWNLTVYSPPSEPVIFPLNNTEGRSLYPFMAGTSGMLRCNSNQSGRPEATFSWSFNATGQTSGGNLTFYNLSKEDNGRTVKCRASNEYTENRRPVADATFILQVYYKPVVSFRDISEENDCVMASDYKYCVVAEGQRAYIHCTADSNPAPASFTWLSPSKDVISNNSELVITSANHLIHHGDYSCTVVTERNGDSRLPLISSATLTVIVGYSPSVISFSINNVDNMTVNVQEKSRVEMKCLSKGRPTPSIQLINSTEPEQSLNETQPTGNISVDKTTEEVTLTIEDVQCEASRVYRCDVNNSLGQDKVTRTLLVSCAPRRIYIEGKAPIINITSGRGELIFRITAYPIPMVKKITFHGTNETSDGQPTKENTINVECSASSLAPAAFTCIIRVVNLTRSDEGFYRILLSNNIGELPFMFSVKEAVSGTEEKGEASTMSDDKITIIVLAVAFSVLAVVIVVVVIWSWRRGWMLPCADISHQRPLQQNEIRDNTSEKRLTSTTTSETSSLYDALKMHEVGKRSHYEEIQRYQNTPAIPSTEDASDYR
ncbi:uncharacterized protein LOC112568894 isoform X2 [Pomacea canaliculata]|uniref:uncharacterized protein LOC112568894 isoform X2 n=1 Tax=Pomacea canaliculata TaxID=400727 RepID=UPI000D736FE1|nr:uncharacterized protein LOC112568894 isoform X2 [Pomacea canaliculata]